MEDIVNIDLKEEYNDQNNKCFSSEDNSDDDEDACISKTDSDMDEHPDNRNRICDTISPSKEFQPPVNTLPDEEQTILITDSNF